MGQTVLSFDQNWKKKKKKNRHIKDNMGQIVLALIQFLKCI